MADSFDWGKHPITKTSTSKPESNDVYKTGTPDYQASGSIQTMGQPKQGNNEQFSQQMQEKFAPTLSQSIAKRPDLEKAINFVKPIAKGAGNFAAGAGLSAADAILGNAASVANLAPDTINLIAGTNLPRMQGTNFKQYTPEGLSGQAGNLVGDVAGNLVGGGAAFKALGAVPKLSNEASILANAARGATAGFATGSENPGGRFASAAEGAAGGVGVNMTNKSLADTLLKQYKGAQNKYSQGFKSLFENTPGEVKPIKDYGVIVPENLNLASVKKDLTSAEKKVINNYTKNPTFENAHEAQSLLGKYIEPLKKSRNKDRGAFKKVGELNAATKAYNSLKSGINQALETIDNVSGHNIYSDQYKALKQGYEKDVVPFFGNKLEDYESNAIGAKDVVKNVLKDKHFMEYEKKGKRIITGPGKENTMLRSKQAINQALSSKPGQWLSKAGQVAAGTGLTGLTGYGSYKGKQYYDENN